MRTAYQILELAAPPNDLHERLGIVSQSVYHARVSAGLDKRCSCKVIVAANGNL
jgi:hypothetical protein